MKANYSQYLESFFGMLDEINAEEKTPTEFEKQKETEIVNNIVKLMKMDLHEILNILLKSRPEFPLAPSVSKCLQKVIQDKTLLVKMFNYLTDIINNPEQVLYVDVNVMMFNATLFIGVIMEPKEEILANLTKKYFYQLLGTFLLRFGTAFESRVNAQENLEKDAIKFALWSFQSFLQCADDKPILNALEGYGLQKKLVTDFDEGVSELILIICKNCKWQKIKVLVDFLKPFLTKKIQSQKEVVVIVLAQLIFSCLYLEEFVEEEGEFFQDFKQFEDWILDIIDTLLDSIESKSEIIRKYCYRGIGNIAYLFRLRDNQRIQDTNTSVESLLESIIKRSPIILKTLLRGLEDNKTCIRESLSSFQKISDLISFQNIIECFLDVCHKLRSSFESGDAPIRASAFNLIGNLFKIVTTKAPQAKDGVMEELHFNLISIILHLNDDNVVVRQACASSLKEISVIMDIPDIKYKSFFLALCSREIVENKQASENGHLDPVENQLVKFAELIHTKFGQKSTLYLYGSLDFMKSPEDSIRATAVFFFMALISVMDLNSNITIPDLENLLENCFTDKCAIVRQKIAKGYSLLSKVHKMIH